MKIKWAKEVKTPKQDLEVQLNLMLTPKKKKYRTNSSLLPLNNKSGKKSHSQA